MFCKRPVAIAVLSFGGVLASGLLDVAVALADRPIDGSEGQPTAAVPTAGGGARTAVTQIAFQGFLTDPGGSPINGTVSLTLRLWDAATGGATLWSEIQAGVVVTNGVFAIALGSVAPLETADFSGSPIYLGVAVNGEAELPRTQILAAPFAIRATEADHALTADIAADGLWTLQGEDIRRATGRVIMGGSVTIGDLDINFGGGDRYASSGIFGKVDQHVWLDTRGWKNATTIAGRHGTTNGSTTTTGLVLNSFYGSSPRAGASLVVDARAGAPGLIRCYTGNSTADPIERVRISDTGLSVYGTTSTNVLQITGADLVESFNTSGEACEPGMVMTIDDAQAGNLKPASTPYDRRVAGVVSGAGGVAAGIYMGNGGVLEGDTPVAMTGRVYTQCTADNGPIAPGDLLTTASLPGHAMRATDPVRRQGAVIGKAMSALNHGQGLVLVLIQPQ